MTDCSLCTCLPLLCILGEFYIKYQNVILMWYLLFQKCVTVPLTSKKQNSSQRFLRVCVLSYKLHFGSSKIPFFFLTLNWFLLTYIGVYKYHQHYFICIFLDYFRILLSCPFEVIFSQSRIYSESISQCFLIKWNSHLLNLLERSRCGM